MFAAVAMYRCPLCNKLLFFAHGLSGRLYVECSRCHLVIAIQNGKIVTKKPFKQKEAPVTSRNVQLQWTDAETVLQAVQTRWDQQKRDKALQRTSLAVGLRFAVFMRDRFQCTYCGVNAEQGALLETDHVVPKSKGGLDTMENLITACWECNSGKSNKLLTKV